VPRTTVEVFAALVIVPALLMLGACGGAGRIACPLASSCSCGSSNADACREQVFLYAGGSGQINGFPVQSDGSLSAPASTTGGGLSSQRGMASLGGQFLYAGTNAGDFANNIDAWSINENTGALTGIPGYSLGPGDFAAGMAANPVSQVIYAADMGQIDAFKADANGALTPLPGSPYPTGSNLFITVDPQYRFVYATDDDPPGGVFAFTINGTTGALAAVPGSPFLMVPGSNGNTLPAQVVVDSSGSFVFTPLTNSNQVAAFAITPSTGALTPVPGSPFAAGNRPFAIATANNFVYVSNPPDSTISGYSFDAATGILTPLANSPFGIAASALATNPFAPVLYASTASGIEAYTIDAQSGNLTPLAGSPYPSPAVTVFTFVP